jgi:hypothetical protein
MSISGPGCLLGTAAMAVTLLFAPLVAAESRPPAAPAPKAGKWSGPDLDAAKGRAPAKGKGFYSLPEVDDEVLVLKDRRNGR